MTADRYTKAVLTVIAVGVVWLCLGGRALIPAVGAQQGVTEVFVAGWRDVDGKVWRLPSVVTNYEAGPGGLSIDAAAQRRKALEGVRASGVALPTMAR